MHSTSHDVGPCTAAGPAVDGRNAVAAELTAQHQRMLRLCVDVMNSHGVERRCWFDDLRALLARHQVAEEVVLHPLLRATLPDGAPIPDTRPEQDRDIRKSLARLETTTLNSNAFDAEFGEVQQSLAHRFQDEEAEELARLGRLLDCDVETTVLDSLRRVQERIAMASDPGVPASVGHVIQSFEALLGRAREVAEGVA